MFMAVMQWDLLVAQMLEYLEVGIIRWNQFMELMTIGPGTDDNCGLEWEGMHCLLWDRKWIMAQGDHYKFIFVFSYNDSS
mgnify:CR=1 FL=1